MPMNVRLLAAVVSTRCLATGSAVAQAPPRQPPVDSSLVTGGGHTSMNARQYLAETLQRYFK